MFENRPPVQATLVQKLALEVFIPLVDLSHFVVQGDSAVPFPPGKILREGAGDGCGLGVEYDRRGEEGSDCVGNGWETGTSVNGRDGG